MNIGIGRTRCFTDLRKIGLTAAIVVATASVLCAATEDLKLTSTGITAGDSFGFSVAVSGDTAVVGAAYDDQNGYASGSVYVFVRNGNTWTEEQKLTASDAAVEDNFGVSVGISGDTIIVGTYVDDPNLGAAYIFTRSGSTWTEEAKLIASDTAVGDRFGTSVTISGNTAVIGAYYDDDDGQNSGSAYVFTRSGTTWTEEAKLTASDAFLGDDFGRFLSLSGDTCVIGAPYEGWETSGYSYTGAAYIYTRSGTTWTEEAKLRSPDTSDIAFGSSVSVSGNTAFIGTPHFSPSPGFVYVYTRTGTTWSEEQKLAASDGLGGDNFGVSVSVTGDTAVVGAWEDDSRTGSAYVFTRTGTVWSEVDKIVASDGHPDAAFGWSVASSGGTVFAGAPYQSDVGQYSGSAYVFGLVTDTDGDGVPDDVDCNPTSDLSPTIVIDGIETLVFRIYLFDDGCSMSDDIAAIAAAASSHGQFVAAVSEYRTN